MRMEKIRLWICVIAAMITLSACGVSSERTSQVSSDTRQTSSEEASAGFRDNSTAASTIAEAASEVPTASAAQTLLPTETIPPTPPAYPPVTKAPAATIAPTVPPTAAPQGKMVVYWANTGDKIHIKPNCHTIKKGVLSGTLAEAKAAGREGWCGVCSKGWTDERFLKSGNPYAD